MVKRVGIVTVDIEKHLYEKIATESNKENLSIRKFVNQIIEEKFEKDQFLNNISPKLSLIEFTEESILIRDETAKKSRFAEIIIKNEKLWCSLDEKENCSHVRFAFMLPGLVKLKDKLKQI